MVIHDTEKYQLRFIEDQILRILIKKNVELEVEDMDDLLSVYSNLLVERKVPFLVVFDEFANITQEARAMISNENRSTFKIKEAVVVKSLSQRLLISFEINSHVTAHQTKLFNSEDKAMEWITQSFSQEQEVQAVSA